MTKSSKRSAAKARQRPPDPRTYYIDECLGRTVAEVLAANGHDVRQFDEFAGRPDAEWLPLIGARGWVLITKDKNIRRNRLEVEAFLNAGVRAFVKTAANMDRRGLAELIRRAMLKIARICRQSGPFIYTITGTGIITQVSNRSLLRRTRSRGR